MIKKVPIELEPPSPMQPPPLRKEPFIIPQLGNASYVALTVLHD